jgi:hypothetical protein
MFLTGRHGLKVIHNIMIVKKQAHWLPHNTKEEPKHHVANHGVMKSLMEIIRQKY